MKLCYLFITHVNNAQISCGLFSNMKFHVPSFQIRVFKLGEIELSKNIFGFYLSLHIT